MYESNDQMVSHPSHYMSDSGLETIDVIEAFTKDLDGIEAYDTGNVIKYICRWKNKGGVQDLEKAMWYIQHLIDHEDSVIRAEELRNKLDDDEFILSIDDPNPDYLIYNSFNEQDKNPKYANAIRIAFFTENIFPDLNYADYIIGH